MKLLWTKWILLGIRGHYQQTVGSTTKLQANSSQRSIRFATKLRTCAMEYTMTFEYWMKLDGGS